MKKKAEKKIKTVYSIKKKKKKPEVRRCFLGSNRGSELWGWAKEAGNNGAQMGDNSPSRRYAVKYWYSKKHGGKRKAPHICSGSIDPASSLYEDKETDT